MIYDFRYVQGLMDDIAVERNRIVAMEARLEAADEKLHKIKQWCDAYPLEVFPEPDLKRVRELLEAGGITLDCVSASMMRCILGGIQAILEEA